MKITWFGHSNFQIESNKKILIDPFFKGNPAIKDQSIVDEIEVDFVIITHAHADHLGDTIEICKRTGAIAIANFEIVNHLTEKGVKAHPLHIGGKKKFDWGFIKLVPAVHGSSFQDGSYGGYPAGVVINIEGKNIYHCGDTGLSYEFMMIGETMDIDLVMLPVGDNFTMDVHDAAIAAKWVKTKKVIPMHYNTFDLIKVEKDEIIESFKDFDLILMDPGETVNM
ncbi:MAG: metal-dependent hydrolase [Candidatus Muiribacterium halophilum]|uniref:UPF0173 metal-dependent hydrolase C0601_12090 n=1 Tax=Muiribacterium halophilum TaxID=2053465 RepID=A0A2N5ZAW8_MUIH1|nr:MAG: metal-dependent hydrolase [Candidatus Muirbacterium halophilum]